MRYLLMMLFLCGCAELRVLTPGPVVQPPEVGGGDFKFRIEGGALEGEMYEVTGYAGARPPDLAHPHTDDSYFIPVGASVSYGDWFDVGLGLYASELGGGYARAQIQLLGDGARSAKAGNFSLALFGRGNYTSGDNKGDQSTTFGAGGYPWKAEAKIFGVEGGASFGYRLTDSFMIFAGAARTWHDGQAEITQDPANGDSGGKYKTEFTGMTKSVQLGMNLGRQGLFSLTGGYYESQIGTLAQRYWTAVNLLIQVPVGK